MSGRSLALVGSYGDEDTITVVAIGPDDRIEAIASLPGPTNASFVLVGPDGLVHVTSEVEVGRVHSYALSRSDADVELLPTGDAPSGGAQPCHLATDPTGRWVVVANYGDGTVAVLDSAGGDLTGPVSRATHVGSGPRADRQAGPHAHGTAFAPDGRTLVAADLGADQLVVYDLDEQDGSLTLRGAIATTPGAGPRHLVFDDAGDHLFVVNELANSVTSYAFEPTESTLHRVDERSTLPTGIHIGQAAAIRFSPSGPRLLVSNRGHDSIAAIPVEQSGSLGEPSFGTCGGAWPRDLTITPDRTGIVVANEHDGLVTLLRYDPAAGRVGPAIDSVAVPSPACVAFV